MQVPLGNQILQQIDEGGTRISAGMEVDHVVGAAELEERLRLQDKVKDRMVRQIKTALVPV